MTDDRGQKTDARGQMTEGRSQMILNAEVGMRRSESLANHIWNAE